MNSWLRLNIPTLTSDKGFVEAFGSDLMRIGVSLEIVVRLFFYIVRIVSD